MFQFDHFVTPYYAPLTTLTPTDTPSPLILLTLPRHPLTRDTIGGRPPEGLYLKAPPPSDRNPATQPPPSGRKKIPLYLELKGSKNYSKIFNLYIPLLSLFIAVLRNNFFRNIEKKLTPYTQKITFDSIFRKQFFSENVKNFRNRRLWRRNTSRYSTCSNVICFLWLIGPIVDPF